MSVKRNEHGLYDVYDDETGNIFAWNHDKEMAKALDADNIYIKSLERAVSGLRP